jgi:hypothetical protein
MGTVSPPSWRTSQLPQIPSPVASMVLLMLFHRRRRALFPARSATQQSGLWSRGSDEQDLSSPPTTTPSQANPTKRQRGSRTSRSEADNGHVVDTPAEHNGSEIVSPTTDAGGVFAQPSSDASARPFICHKLTLSMNVCLKGFEKRSGLRYVHP